MKTVFKWLGELVVPPLAAAVTAILTILIGTPIGKTLSAMWLVFFVTSVAVAFVLVFLSAEMASNGKMTMAYLWGALVLLIGVGCIGSNLGDSNGSVTILGISQGCGLILGCVSAVVLACHSKSAKAKKDKTENEPVCRSESLGNAE